MLANDSDDDADPLAITIVNSPPDDPTIPDEGGIIYYRPSQEAPGTVILTYRATDSYGAGANATVTVNVVDADQISPVVEASEAAEARARANALVVPSVGNATQEYYVSAAVTQDGDGLTPQTAFKSVSTAKTAALQFIAGNAPANVTIYLMPGKHPLTSTLTTDPESAFAPGLTFSSSDIPEHSSITIRNDSTCTASNPAVLTGALEFWHGSGGSWTNFTSPFGGTIKKFTFTGANSTELVDRINKIRAVRSDRLGPGQRDKSPVFTQMFVERPDAHGNLVIQRKVRSRHPNGRANVDTSRFTYNGALPPPENQEPIVRAQFQLGPNGTTNVANGNTEIAFTRMWTNPRGVIASATNDPKLAGFKQFSIARMENPTDVLGNLRYDEFDLAEQNRVTSIPNGISYRGDGTVNPQSYETWNTGWMENNLDFVDQAGEWYLDDRDNDGNGQVDDLALYYKPSAGEVVESTSFRIQIPVTFTLVSLTGAPSDDGVVPTNENDFTGVRFVGDASWNVQPAGTPGGTPKSAKCRLALRYSAWQYENGRIEPGTTPPLRNHDFYSFQKDAYGLSGVIDGMYLQRLHLQIIGCEISHYGASGVALGGNRSREQGLRDISVYDAQPRGRVTYAKIEKNYFDDGGGSAVRIDDYPKLSEAPPIYGEPTIGDVDNNVIAHNSIHRIGRVFADCAAIYVSYGFNTEISNNHISRIPNRAITVGTKCARSPLEQIKIKQNTIDRSMLRLADGGAVHLHGGSGTKIQNNRFFRTGLDADRTNDAVDYKKGGLDRRNYINDIYLDNLSAGCTVQFNVGDNGFPSNLVLKYHPDMFDPPPGLRIDADKEYVRAGQRPHKISYDQLSNPAIGHFIEGLKCPAGNDEPLTCGCAAVMRYEAETHLITKNPANLSATPDPTNQYLVVASQKGNSVTFQIENPELVGATQQERNKKSWYNLRIQTAPSSGSYSIAIKMANGTFDIVRNHAKRYDKNDKAIVLAGDESARLTEFRRLLPVTRDGEPITFRLTAEDNKGLAFDYFRLYRAADQGF